MSVRAFTASLSNAIIERVKEHPEIWQFSHPLYKKRFVHQMFWAELAEEHGVNAKVLKKRWKHLKDQYRKELKRAMELNKEDKVTWPYFKSISFYRGEVVHRDAERAVAAAIDAESSNEEEEPEKTQEKEPSRKIVRVKKKDESVKLNAIFKRLNEMKSLLETKTKEFEARNEDPDYMFLVSLLPSMKQLTEVQKLQLRGKINSWLLDAMTVKEYVNACDPDNDDDIPTVMEIIKCESD